MDDETHQAQHAMMAWRWLDDPLEGQPGFVVRMLRTEAKHPVQLQYGPTIWRLTSRLSDGHRGGAAWMSFSLRYQAAFLNVSTVMWPVARFRLHRAVTPLSARIPMGTDASTAIEGLLAEAGVAIDRVLRNIESLPGFP